MPAESASVGGPGEAPTASEQGNLALIRQITGHVEPVSHLAFSADGKLLASGAGAGAVKLWDMQTAELLHSFTGHRVKRDISVAFHAREPRLATADDDGDVRIWDLQSGTLLRKFHAHDKGLYKIAYSPDGNRVATAAFDETLRLWDVQTGKELLRCDDQPRLHFAIDFSHDGRYIASAQRSGEIRLYDADAGHEVRTFYGHQDRVQDVAFSADDRLLFSGSYDRTLRVWDVETGRQIALAVERYHVMNTLAVLPEARLPAGAGPEDARYAVATAGGVWKPIESRNEWAAEPDHAIRLWRLEGPRAAGASP